MAAAAAAEKLTDGGFAKVTKPGSPERETPVLPPGAGNAESFYRKCVSCQLCVKNCPMHCIVPSTSLSRCGQPKMDFREGYCHIKCTRCSEVCPTDAIAPLTKEEKRTTHIGHAVWNKDTCLRQTEGVECVACERKCPVKAIHIVKGVPVVDKLACLGCGACEHVCPARPMPAIFVKGFDRQRIVAPIGESDLLAEMVTIVKGGVSCAVAKDGVIVAREAGRGIMPIMKLLGEGRLAHGVVVDKVVGRAADAACTVGKAKRVHALIMGADAAAMLKKHGIVASAEKNVPKILNRDLTDGCPMAHTVEGINSPDELV
jgi:formate hydrogenlyase subunit 6/NADH:ubiquinone oxidoreductase subunit I